MDWVNLLQDGAIICLVGCQIASFFSLRRMRESSPAGSWSLIEEAEASGRGPLSPVCWDYGTGVLNPRLFRKGDSVRIAGSDEEFVLDDYRYGAFAADCVRDGVTYSAHFPVSSVTAWKRNSGEWPVEWVPAGSSDQSSSVSDASSGDTTIAGPGRPNDQPKSRDRARLRAELVDTGTSSNV